MSQWKDQVIRVAAYYLHVSYAIMHVTSFVQYNRPSLPVLFWRVVFLNTTLKDRQPAKPDLAVPRLV